MNLHFSSDSAPSVADWSSWQWQLSHAATTLAQVASYLGLPLESLQDLQDTAERYPLFATPYYLSLTASAALDDPILRQCLPDRREITAQCGGSPDALAEERCSPVPRLVHRYPDRALFVTGNFCCIHCRHCMRKRDWSKTLPPPTDQELDAACGYLRQHPIVREVLISGGDPLMLSEEALKRVIDAFSAVPSIEMLRFGSRVPVALPQRITPQLAQLLASGKPAWLSTHFNHPAELTEEARRAADVLTRHGVSLVNQSVLLKGVNDDAATLGRLFTKLLSFHIKPYYLFHGDPIEGAMHFRTGIQAGLDIMNRLRGRISGMALPAFAFDLPDGAGKIRLQPEHIQGYTAEGAPIFTNYEGRDVAYPNP